MNMWQYCTPFRAVSLIGVLALTFMNTATSQTLVRKSNDDVWLDWRLVKNWSVNDVKSVFSPSGKSVHIATPIPSTPTISFTNNPTTLPKTPINPWCDCPEEYRIHIMENLSRVPGVGDQLLWYQSFEKSYIIDQYLKSIDPRANMFDRTMDLAK